MTLKNPIYPHGFYQLPCPKVPVNRFGIAEATPEVRGFLKNSGGRGGNKRMAYFKGMAGGGFKPFLFSPQTLGK